MDITGTLAPTEIQITDPTLAFKAGIAVAMLNFSGMLQQSKIIDLPLVMDQTVRGSGSDYTLAAAEFLKGLGYKTGEFEIGVKFESEQGPMILVTQVAEVPQQDLILPDSAITIPADAQTAAPLPSDPPSSTEPAAAASADPTAAAAPATDTTAASTAPAP